MVQILSDGHHDQEKSSSVRNQISLWTGLLEARMKFQNLLLITNKLPHPDSDLLRSEKIEPSLAKARKSVNKLLITMLKMREYYHVSSQLNQNEILNEKTQENENDDHEHDNNYEDHSEEGSDEDDDELNSMVGKIPIKKIKMHREVDMDMWSRRHKAVRMALIEKWHEKTKLGVIPQKGKSYDALELPPATLIENVLRDKHRLIRRTQMKRANYYIIGKSPEELQKIDSGNAYDCEIFDDEDFYQQLLKELIDDTSSLSRRQLPRAREKLKRKVDTKASKDRKISMKVHAKLVNFMAPRSYTQSDIRHELLMSLFGGGQASGPQDTVSS